ncbi:putative phage abortive infection protein [Mucilaginibacter sp.]
MNDFLLRNIRFVLWFLIGLVLIHVIILWPIKSSLSAIYNAVNSIAPIVAIILIYLTFNQQRRQVQEAETQVSIAKKEFIRSGKSDFLNRVDQHFILSLNIHRDNVAAMNFKGQVIGKDFFVEVIKCFNDIFNELYIKQNDEIHRYLKRKLSKNDFIDISYRILFYGIGLEIPIETLDHNFKSYHSFLKPDLEGDGGFGWFIYGFWSNQTAMQSNLSHYFRHLYHTITYIHDLEIDQTEKEFYIKRIRGQFSNHEQALFFINSLSIGANWRKYKSTPESTPIDLISTYELIKNLPGNFFEHINHKCYYKKIKYEEDHGIAFEETPKGKRCHEQLPA